MIEWLIGLACLSCCALPVWQPLMMITSFSSKCRVRQKISKESCIYWHYSGFKHFPLRCCWKCNTVYQHIASKITSHPLRHAGHWLIYTMITIFGAICALHLELVHQLTYSNRHSTHGDLSLLVRLSSYHYSGMATTVPSLDIAVFSRGGRLLKATHAVVMNLCGIALVSILVPVCKKVNVVSHDHSNTCWLKFDTGNPQSVFHQVFLASGGSLNTCLVDHPPVTCSLVTSAPITELWLKLLELGPEAWIVNVHNPLGVTFWDVQVWICDSLAFDGDTGDFEEFQDDHPNILYEPDPKWQNNSAYGVGWSLWRWIDESLGSQTVQAVQKSGHAGKHFYIEWYGDGDEMWTAPIY